MDALHYTPVFDVLDPGYRPWLAPTLVGAAVTTFALIFARIAHRRIPSTSTRTSKIVDASVALLVFMAIMTLAISVWDFARAYSTLRSGSALYVEGTVAHFNPMPSRPRGRESFEVTGVMFHYSEHEITGFHQTVRSGGPIHEGLPVHIWYMDAGHQRGNEILKLEVAGN